MTDKMTAIAMLQEEFSQWEALIAPLDEATLMQKHPTLRDDLIHLWAWQQLTRARLAAAVSGELPNYPVRPITITPKSEGDLDAINAWIAQTYQGKTWALTYHDWREGFLRCIALAEQIPEHDLVETHIHAWMWLGEWSLLASLQGTYEHHHEHREAFLV